MSEEYNYIKIINNEPFVYSIILNSSKNGNALNQLLIKELTHGFKKLSKLKSCRVIILESNSKIFCAGADLKELRKMQQNTYAENFKDSKKLMELYKSILSSEKLIIAKVEGAAIAGGCGLATACDVIFANENAKFGYTEVNIGFVPALVSTFLTKRVKLSTAKELFLTGKILTAKEAENIQIIDYYIESKKLEKFMYNYIRNFLEKSSPQSVEQIKKMLYNFYINEKQMDLACKINAKSRKKLDCKKGINRFLKKEKNKWD